MWLLWLSLDDLDGEVEAADLLLLAVRLQGGEVPLQVVASLEIKIQVKRQSWTCQVRLIISSMTSLLAATDKALACHSGDRGSSPDTTNYFLVLLYSWVHSHALSLSQWLGVALEKVTCYGRGKERNQSKNLEAPSVRQTQIKKRIMGERG